MHREQVWRRYLDVKLNQIADNPLMEIAEADERFIEAINLVLKHDRCLGEEYCNKYRKIVNEKESRLIGSI